jgi:hypothetical protein
VSRPPAYSGYFGKEKLCRFGRFENIASQDEKFTVNAITASISRGWISKRVFACFPPAGNV